jgi:putative two-component system response regulator
MAAFATAFGVHLDLGDEALAALHRGGYLHDIGKVGVPDAVLMKPGPLTAEETLIMQRHTIVGDALCGELRLLSAVRPIVRHHHERWDGSGYPDRLKGDAIPLLAQITAVVDVYDALTSDRVYRAPVSSAEACAELQREADLGWHRPDLVGEFVTICKSGRMERLADPETTPVRLRGLAE